MKEKKNEVVIYCDAFRWNATDKQLTPVLVNNEPYFVAVELCEILGLDQVTRALESLDDDEKLPLQLVRAGQKRVVNCVNESGMYALIFKSRKPEAKAFRKWVTAEVLPTLRRTGRYEFAPRAAHTPYSTLATRRRNELFNLETMRLLWLIDSNLMQGDKKDIALLCGTSQNTITRVLTGTQRNARVLFALYERALENSASRMRASLYVDPESAIRDLSKGLPAKINDRMELVKDSIVMGRGSVPASAAIDFTANMQRGGAR